MGTPVKGSQEVREVQKLTRNKVDLVAAHRRADEGAAVADITTKATSGNLDGVAVTQSGAKGLGTAAGPVLAGRRSTLGGLGREGFVLDVKGGDGVAVLAPDVAAVLARVGEDVLQAVIVRGDGIGVFVKVTGTILLAVAVISTQKEKKRRKKKRSIAGLQCTGEHCDSECACLTLTRWLHRDHCRHGGR
jgi:hypothetical protein